VTQHMHHVEEQDGQLGPVDWHAQCAQWKGAGQSTGRSIDP